MPSSIESWRSNWRFADRLGIEKMQISVPVTSSPRIRIRKALNHQVRKNNDIVINAVKKYPDRFMGFFTLNPSFTGETALEEINRCEGSGTDRI
ncbi:MAG: hypothetical protein MZV63_09815 [Marinilabiliales bacterium]|nr:hypothetical protein [Marinilabiliales bacterium]